MRRTTLLIAGLCSTMMATAPVQSFAQADQDRRLDRLDRDVRELRAIVFQGRDTGQPVEVRPAGPDPAVTAVEGRLDQLDQALRTLGGQIEVLTHNTDEAQHSAATARDAANTLRGEVKALEDRLARLEAAQPQAAPSQPPPPGPDSIPVPPVEAGTPPSANDENSAFKAARAQLTAGDYGAASASFQSFVQTYPTSPRLKEGYYWLGESFYVRELYPDATSAYARALKDWPKTSWAPDAVVKLARALVATNRAPQACSALGEFTRRYDATAAKAVKARAAAVGLQAKCGA